MKCCKKNKDSIYKYREQDLPEIFRTCRPPPPPPGPELWELQFCRWWGWNWVKKKDDAGQLNPAKAVMGPTSLPQHRQPNQQTISPCNQQLTNPGNQQVAGQVHQCCTSEGHVYSYAPRHRDVEKRVRKKHFSDLCRCLCCKKKPKTTSSLQQMYSTPSNSVVVFQECSTCGVFNNGHDSVTHLEIQRNVSRRATRGSCGCQAGSAQAETEEESVEFLNIQCQCCCKEQRPATAKRRIINNIETQTEEMKQAKVETICRCECSNAGTQIQSAARKTKKIVVCCHCYCNCKGDARIKCMEACVGGSSDKVTAERDQGEPGKECTCCRKCRGEAKTQIDACAGNSSDKVTGEGEYERRKKKHRCCTCKKDAKTLIDAYAGESNGKVTAEREYERKGDGCCKCKCKGDTKVTIAEYTTNPTVKVKQCKCKYKDRNNEEVDEENHRIQELTETKMLTTQKNYGLFMHNTAYMDKFRPWDTMLYHQKAFPQYGAPSRKYPWVQGTTSDILDTYHRLKLSEEFSSPVTGKRYNLSPLGTPSLAGTNTTGSTLPELVEVKEDMRYLEELESNIKHDLPSRIMLNAMCDAILYDNVEAEYPSILLQEFTYPEEEMPRVKDCLSLSTLGRCAQPDDNKTDGLITSLLKDEKRDVVEGEAMFKERLNFAKPVEKDLQLESDVKLPKPSLTSFPRSNKRSASPVAYVSRKRSRTDPGTSNVTDRVQDLLRRMDHLAKAGQRKIETQFKSTVEQQISCEMLPNVEGDKCNKIKNVQFISSDIGMQTSVTEMPRRFIQPTWKPSTTPNSAPLSLKGERSDTRREPFKNQLSRAYPAFTKTGLLPCTLTEKQPRTGGDTKEVSDTIHDMNELLRRIDGITHSNKMIKNATQAILDTEATKCETAPNGAGGTVNPDEICRKIDEIVQRSQKITTNTHNILHAIPQTLEEPLSVDTQQPHRSEVLSSIMEVPTEATDGPDTNQSLSSCTISSKKKKKPLNHSLIPVKQKQKKK